jgi:hypothetical protein
MKKRCRIPLLVCCLLVAGGCSSRAWYDGLKEQRRSDCYKENMSQKDIDDCLERNSMSYDEYERNRNDYNY